jgi:hypothetical protein
MMPLGERLGLGEAHMWRQMVARRVKWPSDMEALWQPLVFDVATLWAWRRGAISGATTAMGSSGRSMSSRPSEHRGEYQGAEMVVVEDCGG